ncbi:hypothetical protein [Sphingomonas glaciei]|uniref:Uncharacterized protein n=1 Tax=Sphingomonas glaciei TaxID=2938948 RepID=A0ABY5MY63_9SPHN|nr:hypothetical protein [Sphingomonas glaciei]UUR09248.1 hypothetical protein M1K48_06465 [Sphingomonas glaciei]
MSTQALRLSALSYDIERALSGEMGKRTPNALRVFRLRRAREALRLRFRRLFSR